MLDHSEYSRGEKTLIYVLEALRVMQENGCLINESGVNISAKGTSTFDQMVAEGFSPTNIELLECLCNHDIFLREHIPYFLTILAATRDKGILWLQESMEELESVSDLDIWGLVDESQEYEDEDD